MKRYAIFNKTTHEVLRVDATGYKQATDDIALAKTMPTPEHAEQLAKALGMSHYYIGEIDYVVKRTEYVG